MEEQNNQNRSIKDDVKEAIRIEKELTKLQERYENIEKRYDSLVIRYKGISEGIKRIEETNDPVPKNLRINELTIKGEIKELKLNLDKINKEIINKQKRIKELEKGIKPFRIESKTVEQKVQQEQTQEKEKQPKQEIDDNKEKDKDKEKDKKTEEENTKQKEEDKQSDEKETSKVQDKTKEEIKEEPKEKKEPKQETKTEEKTRKKDEEKVKKNNSEKVNLAYYDSIYDREEEDDDKEYQIIIDIKRGRAYCFIGGKKEYSEELIETGNSVASAYNKIINTIVRQEDKIPLSNYTEFRHAFKGISPYVVNILARYNTKQLNQYLEDFYNQERDPNNSKYYIQYRNTYYLKEVPKNIRKKLEIEIKSSREIASSDLRMGLLERLKRLKEGKGFQELQTFKQLESRESKEAKFRESLRYQRPITTQRQYEIRNNNYPRPENQRKQYREDIEELHK